MMYEIMAPPDREIVMPRWTKTPMERFSEKVRIDESGCWIWMGAMRGMRGNQYGHMRFNGKLEGAHRVSWILHKGGISPGMKILHRCDVGLCVNPEHLFVGTQSDNMEDMVNKGRHPYPVCEVHHRAKLTNEQVRAIRASAQSHGQLAKAYGVTKRTIINVRQRKVYGSVF